MQTPTPSCQINQPIDAMYLIHKALRAEAGRAEEAVNQLQLHGSFKPFQRVFYRWAMALGYHVEVEDAHLTSRLEEPSLRQAKVEAQCQVMAMLEGLQTYLHEELGRMIVIPRTQRQLRSKVIALRIVQDDLLEEEEDVLPVLRHRMSEAEQLAFMRCLLGDGEAEEAGEMLNWVAQDLTTSEQQWLAALGQRLGLQEAAHA
jgi:hypothetical protein